jgi:hypothetical protein
MQPCAISSITNTAWTRQRLIRNTHLHEPQNSDIREDYLHWYCSGMGFLDGAVDEGVVTDEVRKLFADMGWDIVAYPSEWGV